MIGKVFPKISTRGFYDLKTGKTLNNSSYVIHPKSTFDKISQKQRTKSCLKGNVKNHQPCQGIVKPCLNGQFSHRNH